MREGEARISAPADSTKPVHLVSESTINEILPFPPRLDRLRAKFPRSYSVISVSRPGFDSRKSLALICFSLQHRRKQQPAVMPCQVRVFKRKEKQWVPEVYHRNLDAPGIPRSKVVSLICEVRYYLSSGGQSDSGVWSSFRVEHNHGTNLVCSVEKPGRLMRTGNE